MILLIEYEIHDTNPRTFQNVKLYTLPPKTKLSHRISEDLTLTRYGMLLYTPSYPDDNGIRYVIGHIDAEKYLETQNKLNHHDIIDEEILSHIKKQNRSNKIESIIN